MKKLVWRLLALAAIGGLAASCGSLGYYARSAWGGAKILVAREPIAQLLESDDLDEEERSRLEEVVEIRAFAVRELGLPDNGSYASYVRLDRPHVVWNVVAAPRLAVEPVTWCFPIAGCVAYRGYFSEARAWRFAERLADRGHDVDVSGVAAYSTLGYFADPVLSTFLRYPDPWLAGLLFHELAHQRVWVRDDVTFNESFAGVVEEVGVERWLRSRSRLPELETWRLAQRREREMVELALGVRERLAEVFDSPLSADEKLRRKRELYVELAAQYAERKRSWGGWTGLDGWFGGDLDNADLAILGNYHEAMPGLRGLLESVGGDLERFYQAAKELGDLDLEERHEALDRWATGILGSPREGENGGSR